MLTDVTRAALIEVSGGQLLVDGSPFLIVGGELHNSSASSLPAIERSFTVTADLGANTILAPVAWEQFEPVEGTFDLDLVDAMLAKARALGVRLVLLWFGSWKNGMSSYVPTWVKRDQARFPLAETGSGRVPVLSAFGEASRTADAAAFARLMAHLAEADAEGTVLMVQVENEVGLLGDSRDCSVLAETVWAAPVPAEVVEIVAQHPDMPAHAAWQAAGALRQGTWQQVFGDGPDAGEAFMAHAYATYIEHIAAAGRRFDPRPVYVNAWLASPSMFGEVIAGMIAARRAAGEEIPEDTERQVMSMFAVEGGVVPGTFPSGGPVTRVAPLWRAAAPTLALLAPDIYHSAFDEISADYAAASEALFIPECKRNVDGVAGAYSAFGRHGAIGVSPFGVDSTPGSEDEDLLRDAYAQLGVVADAVRARGVAPTGFVVTADQPTAELRLGRWRMRVDTGGPSLMPPTYPGYGLVVQLGPDEFLIAGRDASPTFTAGPGELVGLAFVEELGADGTVLRRLNGDETASGSAIRLPSVRPPAMPLPIPMMSDSTGILRVGLYTY